MTTEITGKVILIAIEHQIGMKHVLVFGPKVQRAITLMMVNMTRSATESVWSEFTERYKRLRLGLTGPEQSMEIEDRKINR